VVDPNKLTPPPALIPDTMSRDEPALPDHVPRKAGPRRPGEAGSSDPGVFRLGLAGIDSLGIRFVRPSRASDTGTRSP
jgi:hypothetical protein